MAVDMVVIHRLRKSATEAAGDPKTVTVSADVILSILDDLRDALNEVERWQNGDYDDGDFR